MIVESAPSSSNILSHSLFALGSPGKTGDAAAKTGVLLTVSSHYSQKMTHLCEVHHRRYVSIFLKYLFVDVNSSINEQLC